MKAGLVTGLRHFELVDVPEPAPRDGVAVVDISLCGICGTDVHGFLSREPYNPAICGHEWVGTVRALGPGVSGLHEGDRVVAAVARPCGRCDACRLGQSAWCTTAFMGMIGRDPLAPPHGGFSPRIAIAADRLLRAHEGLTDEQAAMVEPTTVALHAVRRTPITAGDTVVVQGCGPIGLLTLQCARAAGAGHVVAVEPNPVRQELALSLGADAAVAPGHTGGALPPSGADVVFECAGVPATVQAAVDIVRRGGTVNLVGLAAGTATIVPGAWLLKEVTVVASLGYLHHEFDLAMGLIADERVRVLPLHDSTVALAD
ncbi:MAG TPA: zinc-binding dehydrogenase, partial [Acidimicrobiales bacterium]